MIASAFGLLATAAAPGSSLPPLRNLQIHGATVRDETYRGCQSIRLEPAMGAASQTAIGLAVLPGPAFHDGVIELSVAGEVAPGSDPGARGFIGIAFRVQPAGKAYEIFYLRPTNGRADDQLRRNHALQYVSEPDYPWYRLRKETPGQYESYADLIPGAWTRMRIEVHGVKARLFVNGATQPQLIVNGLKLGNRAGAIGLWVGPGAIGHFCRSTYNVHPR